MKNIKILDCTLRDGGYINEWAFEDEHIIGILSALRESSINIIECGYLSAKNGNNGDTTLFRNLEYAESLIKESKKRTGLEKSQTKYVIMINHGEFNIDELPDCKNKRLIKGIRYAFHKKNIKSALKQCRNIVNKGYDLYVQPMVTLDYSDMEFLQAVKDFAQLAPEAYYIVDSFGAMHSGQLKRYFFLLANNLPNTSAIGFHSHNNMQLSYASAMMLTSSKSDHQLFVDSSILGMGRGAGNLNTEIFADYLNRVFNVDYNILPILDVIDSYLEPIFRVKPWGFSVAHFLSASMGCHPNYASFFLNRKTLPIKSIQEIMAKIPLDKKSNFDTEFAENIYLETRAEKHTTVKKIKDILFPHTDKKKLLVIAAGPSVLKQRQRILDFIQKNDCCIVSLNHIPDNDIPADFYFFSNQKRFNQHCYEIKKPNKLLLTSNITPLQHQENQCQIIDYNKLAKSLPQSSDNVALLFGEFAHFYGFQTIYFSGLDGHIVDSNKDYYNVQNPVSISASYAEQHNKLITEGLQKLAKSIDIKFITTSIFQRYCPLKVLGVIPARYQSSRFEGKPLAKIAGIPMIKRTYDRAMQSIELDHLVVATDDQRIYKYCVKNNLNVIMTSDKCLTGTDRLAEVAEAMDYDFYVNIQGDEPVISSETISQVVKDYRIHLDKYAAYNLYKKIHSSEETEASTIIKVIVNQQDELMYMSRCAVPFNKSKKTPTFYKQVCVYGFTKHALETYHAQTENTCNEQFEDIEIVRFLDMGLKVKMIETDYDSIAVDIPEDIDKVEKFLNQK